MPGVPKSTGCQICKRRRIKCDETWPACVHCRHMNIECPGPTPLIKFINETPNVSSKATVSPRTSSVASLTHKSRNGNPGPTLRMRRVQYSNVSDKEAGYGLLQASPRSNPTTLADRVGIRLVGNMERGPQGVASLYMTYLPELPKRLAGSSCLRDSVDLFCSAWSDFRRRDLQKGGLMGMPQYGKALRSLRRALIADHESDVETIAAMVLLERTSRLFDLGSHQKDTHLNAIREIFIRRGPPNINDDLDVAATNEIHWLLLRDDSRSENNSFLYTSPWKEALAYCADQNTSFSDVRPYLIDDVWILYRCSKQLYSLLPDFKRASRGSSSTVEASQALLIRHQLQSMREALKDKPIKSWQKALNEGVITKSPDKNSITGHKYCFKSVFLASMYQKILLIRLVTLRMLCKLVDAWGDRDMTLDAEFREVSVYVWKMIPYVRNLESVIAIDMIKPIFFSYEAADDEEKEYLLGSIRQIDSSIERYPQERTDLECIMRNTNQILAYFAEDRI